MEITEDWIKKNYNKWNKEVFEKELPSLKDVEIIIHVSLQKEIGEAACAYSYEKGAHDFKLIFTNYFEFDEDFWESLLMHELIHLYDYVAYIEHYEEEDYDNHGEWFLEQARIAEEKTGIKVYPEMKSDVLAFPKREVNNVKGVVCICYDPDGDDIPDTYFVMTNNEYTKWWNTHNRYTFGFKRIDVYQYKNENLPVFALIGTFATSETINNNLYIITDDVLKVVTENFDKIDSIEKDLKERTNVMKFDEYNMNEIARNGNFKKVPTLLSSNKYTKKKLKDGIKIKTN